MIIYFNNNKYFLKIININITRIKYFLTYLIIIKKN